MITKAMAQQLAYRQELHYTGKHDCTRTVGPRGGVQETITHVRVSGQCKTWVRDPEKFRLPVKYGLYESSAVEPHNAQHFHLPADCPLNVSSTGEESIRVNEYEFTKEGRKS